MKRKHRFIILIGLLSALFLVGCTNNQTPPEEDNTPEPQNPVEEVEDDEEEATDRNFIVAAEEDLPQAARDWMGEYEKEQGAYVYQHPDGTFIKIIAGEKPTGGYAVEVKEYDESVYPRKVTMAVHEPAEDEVTTQALTYPTVIIRVESDQVSQYEVVTKAEEAYEVKEHIEFAKLELPAADAVIDNPVQVKGKIVAFEGAFVVRILDDQGELVHEEFLQASEGGPHWGTFDQEITFSDPNALEGTIQLGEYSAKDGEYIMRTEVWVKF